MVVDIECIKAAIDEQVNIIKMQLKGECESKITKGSAIDKLGVISAIVIELCDLVQDERLNKEIWSLKEESDNMLEQLFKDILSSC